MPRWQVVTTKDLHTCRMHLANPRSARLINSSRKGGSCPPSLCYSQNFSDTICPRSSDSCFRHISPRPPPHLPRYPSSSYRPPTTTLSTLPSSPSASLDLYLVSPTFSLFTRSTS